MRMFFLAVGDRKRASSRLRVWDHVEWFRSQGNRVSADFVSPSSVQSLSVGLALRILARYPAWIWRFFLADAIVIQETLLPTFLLLFKNLGKRRMVVFDFSDPIDMIGTGWKNRIRCWLFRVMTKSADHVIFENPSYYSDLKFRRKSVRHFFGPVDVDRYTEAKRANDLAEKSALTVGVTIGWTGSPATLHLIDHLFPVLDRIARQRPITLTLIGISVLPFKFSHLDVQLLDWTESTEFYLVPKFDVGLFSLDDTEKSKKRGAGKLFIYMAAGVPFVASNIGIASDLMRDANVGFSISAEVEWEREIIHAIDCPELRKDYSIRGVEYAKRSISYQRYRQELLQILSPHNFIPML